MMKTTTVARLLPHACLFLLGLPRAHAGDANDQSTAGTLAWSANAGAVSQYVSRGFRQTRWSTGNRAR